MHREKPTDKHIYTPTHTHMCSKQIVSSDAENKESCVVFGQHLDGQLEYLDVEIIGVTGRDAFFQREISFSSQKDREEL